MFLKSDEEKQNKGMHQNNQENILGFYKLNLQEREMHTFWSKNSNKAWMNCSTFIFGTQR